MSIMLRRITDGRMNNEKENCRINCFYNDSCCCRGCIFKWHRIPKGRELTNREQQYVVNVLMKWIEKQMEE